eukprot:scaffold8259_cov143-Cylindrotheca_fusiformis.AAC.15
MRRHDICSILLVPVAVVFVSFLPFITAFASTSSLLPLQKSFSKSSFPPPSNIVLYSDSYSTRTSDDGEGSDWLTDTASEVKRSVQRNEMKKKLMQLCASYDRGYGASPSAKNQVDDLVLQLKQLNPTKENAAAGIDGGPTSGTVPLRGNWRMIWTTALDVLNLGANPIIAPGAIYQKIEPPVATNIIDFIPRIQTLFPFSLLPPSLLRAEVKTRTSSRPMQSSNRVGLTFEAVKLEPVEVLGFQNNGSFPPFSVNLPQINLQDLPGVAADGNTPGYFDVIYLDDEMLIIQQNEPGGYFVSIRAPNCDP